MKNIFLALVGMCITLILSNLIYLEKVASYNKYCHFDVKLTAPLLPWLCSFSIMIFLISITYRWYKYRYSQEPKRAWGGLLILLVALGLITYSAFAFLDKDTYEYGNFGYTLICLGLSQFVVAAADLVLVGALWTTTDEIRDYIQDLYRESHLSAIATAWGLKVAFGLFSLCLGFLVLAKPQIPEGFEGVCLALLIAISVLHVYSTRVIQKMNQNSN